MWRNQEGQQKNCFRNSNSLYFCLLPSVDVPPLLFMTRHISQYVLLSCIRPDCRCMVVSGNWPPSNNPVHPSLRPYPGDGERHVEVLPSLQPEAPRRRAVQSHCVRARLCLHVGKRWEQQLYGKQSAAVSPVARSWSSPVRCGLLWWGLVWSLSH